MLTEKDIFEVISGIRVKHPDFAFTCEDTPPKPVIITIWHKKKTKLFYFSAMLDNEFNKEMLKSILENVLTEKRENSK